MTTALFSHTDCLGHNPQPGHPECPERFSAVMEALDHPDFENLLRREAPFASRDDVALVHPREHVDAVLDAMPAAGDHILAFDGDTAAGPGTHDAVLRGVGAAIACVDAVMSFEVQNGFCAVRPPGHHAEAEKVMGFCFFNGVAVAAQYARAKYGLTRVAVVDFDVHHGNGTQAIFWADPNLFYGSTHQAPFYPGSGAASETGQNNQGNIVNAPLAAGAGSGVFRAAMQGLILPALEEFAPELVLISAGFDAHKDDPLGGLALVEADFSWATEALCSVAKAHAQDRVVSVLEGGYNLDALGRSAAAHVKALMAA